jgi:hypothetical protein
MKLSWIYDMHFDESVRMLLKRGYLDRIINKLPCTDEILIAVKSVREYIAERLGNDSKE